jgi:glutamyl-tRNA synthetase
VRFEDLDRVTSSREAAARQLADLAAIGIEPVEPPVFQSDRFDLYDRAIDDLIARGLTYPCFCTRREIREAAQAPHGDQVAYPGTCRLLSPRERARRTLERPGAVRLNAEAAGLVGAFVAFRDVLAGAVSGAVDDVVLRRNDGVPAYNVAVVVDDAAQGVTEVVRGDDLLAVTPTQVALQRLLGLPTPDYMHVPLMMGPDGERLSKRHGAVTLADLSREGVSASDVRRRLVAEVTAFAPFLSP